MITHFHIENFKSLADFDLPPKGQELAGFTCLIGMNGAGKSTLLQAFDFTAQLMVGRVGDWLKWREWTSEAVLTHLGGESSRSIRVAVEMKLAEGRQARWNADFDMDRLRCTAEALTVEDLEILKLDPTGSLTVMGAPGSGLREFEAVPFEYQGSLLSTLRLDGLHTSLQVVKNILLSLHSLELLAPQLIRRSSRESADIGPGGERLAGFISQLPEKQQQELLSRLQKIYPQIQNLRIEHKVYGWKGLLVAEQGMGGHEVTEAHINDGFLRVLAMLSQAYSRHGILLLDEIENGINPAVADELVDFLVSLSREGRQIIVTTHSPVILNYLEDDVAREGVILLFKTPDGRTHCRRYFDVPENERKLRALGPGEIFLDTSIEALVERLAAEEPQPKLAA
jgi:predicted ATPase